MTVSLMSDDSGDYRIIDDLTPSKLITPLKMSLFLAGITQKVKEDVCQEVNIPAIRMEMSRLKFITWKQQTEIDRLNDIIEKMVSAMGIEMGGSVKKADRTRYKADECFLDDVFDNEDDFIKWVMED